MKFGHLGSSLRPREQLTGRSDGLDAELNTSCACQAIRMLQTIGGFHGSELLSHANTRSENGNGLTSMDSNLVVVEVMTEEKGYLVTCRNYS